MLSNLVGYFISCLMVAEFAVKNPDGWAQLPLVFPMRTGIVLMDGVAESSGHSEIMSLTTHAEVCLRLRLPHGRHFRFSWYQGIEGFTGWHAGLRTFNYRVKCWCCSHSAISFVAAANAQHTLFLVHAQYLVFQP
jgi:hypothetical protein